MCTNKLLHAGFPLTLCSDTLLNVFLAIAVDNLANAQELTKVHYSPILLSAISFLNAKNLKSYAPLLNDSLSFIHSVSLFPLHSSLLISDLALSHSLSLCRMNKRKRRPPVRRSPCRKPRRWLKSARYLLPTSPLQREVFFSVTVALLFLYPFETFFTGRTFRAKQLHIYLYRNSFSD